MTRKQADGQRGRFWTYGRIVTNRAPHRQQGAFYGSLDVESGQPVTDGAGSARGRLVTELRAEAADALEDAADAIREGDVEDGDSGIREAQRLLDDAETAESRL